VRNFEQQDFAVSEVGYDFSLTIKQYFCILRIMYSPYVLPGEGYDTSRPASI
jgi:hypothetical protein